MLPDPELDAFIVKYGLPGKGEWDEAKNEKTLRAHLQQIRSIGYVKQVTAGNIVGFAVAVYASEKVVASLALYLPEYRFHLNEEEKIVSDLLATAAKINKNLSV